MLELTYAKTVRAGIAAEGKETRRSLQNRNPMQGNVWKYYITYFTKF
jgi:hypothetical protein